MNSLEVIKELEKKKKLDLLEKLLAVTNGSVTQMLEIATGEPIKIKTLNQEVKRAGEMAIPLGVSQDDEVNFRSVEITNQKGKVLIRAKSWIPISRLEPVFKEDLMGADVPIGKLLIKHNIEARRELVEAKVERGKVVRTYDIIRFGRILMRIEEHFEGLDSLKIE